MWRIARSSPQVPRATGVLQREQRLDRALDPEEELVDLVVEGDYLVGEG